MSVPPADDAARRESAPSPTEGAGPPPGGNGEGAQGSAGSHDAPVTVPSAEAHPPLAPEDAERLMAERDEFLNALQLVKADFDNYRRRVDRDRAAERQAAGRDVLLELLPVMDNLDRALAALGDADDGVRSGVEMVCEQLAAVLRGRGVTEIEADSQPFDPTVHEAVVRSPTSGAPEGTIVAVIEKGYRQADTVIRPARVVVAAGEDG